MDWPWGTMQIPAEGTGEAYLSFLFLIIPPYPEMDKENPRQGSCSAFLTLTRQMALS